MRQETDQGVDHRLGHGETRQRRIDADTIGIALGDYSVVTHHNHRLGSAERRSRGLLEGVVERRLQLRVGRLDNGRTGNLRQQRRLFRRLQDRNVAPEQIGFIGSVQHDAAGHRTRAERHPYARTDRRQVQSLRHAVGQKVEERNGNRDRD